MVVVGQNHVGVWAGGQVGSVVNVGLCAARGNVLKRGDDGTVAVNLNLLQISGEILSTDVLGWSGEGQCSLQDTVARSDGQVADGGGSLLVCCGLNDEVVNIEVVTVFVRDGVNAEVVVTSLLDRDGLVLQCLVASASSPGDVGAGITSVVRAEALATVPIFTSRRSL